MSKDRTTSKHHRKPESRGGDESERNISIVKHCQHEAWHRLFTNLHPEIIAIMINRVWLDPDFEFICVERRKP